MRARALIAQPFASSTGPRLRFFNLNHATIMAGPEINNIKPIIAKGICQNCNPNIPLTSEARMPPIAPSASPIAAKIPANLPTSKGGLGVGGGGAVPAAIGVLLSTAALINFSSDAAAFDAAIFCN